MASSEEFPAKGVARADDRRSEDRRAADRRSEATATDLADPRQGDRRVALRRSGAERRQDPRPA